jgi:hypothetical protein
MYEYMYECPNVNDLTQKYEICTYTYMFIYIYIHTHTHIYIYINHFPRAPTFSGGRAPLMRCRHRVRSRLHAGEQGYGLYLLIADVTVNSRSSHPSRGCIPILPPSTHAVLWKYIHRVTTQNPGSWAYGIAYGTPQAPRTSCFVGPPPGPYGLPWAIP